MRRCSPLSNAPGSLGAFAFLLLTLLASCQEEQKFPAWPGDPVTGEAAGGEPESEAAEAAPVPEVAPDGSLRFVSYNLKNWLTMDRYVDRKPVGGTSKPDSEKQAAVAIIARAKPDVLGVCEIGTPKDLRDLQQRLKEAGVDLPNRHHSGGWDDTRFLGFLSKFPFEDTVEHRDLDYELEGKPFEMSRGILDVTVDLPGEDIRFLGVHLKSKREIPEADQEMMRRSEAHLLRREVDRILAKDDAVRLVVYGDLNDTRQSSALRTIQGPRQGPKALKMMRLFDSRHEYWTHHWSYQDVYSRFDYVLVSPNLVPLVVNEESRVLDGEKWYKASDHRALLVTFE